MVTFVSLFLSLVTGVQTVELAVDGPVARVVIHVDQGVVGVLDGPPWRLKCDFGRRITPHELEAVAFDSDGAVLHRARQVINLPRPPAEVTIAFETGQDKMPVAARLFWENSEDTEPLSVFALFDGTVLRPDPNDRYVLPDYDPKLVHIVSAEVRFANEVSARSDVTFGGWYGSNVNAQLTAVPIIVEGEPPTAEDLQSIFAARDRPLRVAAVEKNRAQIFMVRDYATMAKMGHHRMRQERTSLRGASLRREMGTEPPEPDVDRVHVVVPNPKKRNNRQLFPTSAGIGLDLWPLEWLAAHLTGDQASIHGQKIADAVAVASFRAAGDGSPRAVLVIINNEPRDWSGYAFLDVRRYLRDLRVPLYVWSVGGQPPAQYEPAIDVTSSHGLKRASKRLLKDLDKQWIVWVEGSHMINEIELTRSVKGIKLAGVD